MPRKVLRSPRFERKTRKKKAKKAVLLGVLSLLLLGVIVYAFSRPEFRIASIEINGTSRVGEEGVRSAVEAGLSGAYFGLIPKSHTLLYPRGAIKQTLLHDFPALSQVSISLQNLAALRVTLREREPLALWCTSATDCFLIDETGFVFSEADEGTEHLYYHFEAEATSTPIGKEAVSPTRLSAFIAFLKQLEGLGFDTDKIILKGADELEVTLRGGWTLLLRESEFEKSLANLKLLLAQNDLLPKKGSEPSVRYIDLRYGNKIYFKTR